MSSDPETLFRIGVSLADSDPLLTAAAYSLAALSGNDRAAYYLGQMFEAGEGISRDTALAAAWYRRAADSQSFARDSLVTLGRPDRGAVTPPVPLSVSLEEDDAVLLSWISGLGPDPHEYRVEFADDTSAVPLASHIVLLSALRTDLPPDAKRWRVLSMDSTGTRIASSGWHSLNASR